jgi:hypothetical protein
MKQPLSDRAIQIIAQDKILAAIHAGEFDHLPGLGKPLASLDDAYDENWWLRRKLQAERLDLLAADQRLRIGDS